MTFTCPYFLPEVMMKFTRKERVHPVTLIKMGIHLIECISGQNSFPRNLSYPVHGGMKRENPYFYQ